MQFVKPMPFEEAVSFLGNRSAIGSQMTSAEWQDVPVALKVRAEFSSEVESVRFLQRSRDWLGDFLSANRETLPDGQTALAVGSRAKFVELAREFAVAQGMGPLDPADAGTIKDITSERRLGLIFNVQTQQADDFGYFKQGMDSDVLNEFPAQRFIRVIDVKEPRSSHAQYEGQVYLKTDPIWVRINEDFGVPWGPWAWGCGHDVEDVDRTEAEDLGLVEPGETVVPEEKSFNDGLEASTRGIEPDLVAKLRDEFGDQIEIDEENEVMRWSDQN